MIYLVITRTNYMVMISQNIERTVQHKYIIHRQVLDRAFKNRNYNSNTSSPRKAET